MSDLLELIAANCTEHPTAAALGRPEGTFLDHAALHRIVVAMGDTLRSVGIARADRIALCLPDALQAAVAFIAVATHAVCAPMNPRYRRVEIEFHLKDLGICALVVPEDEDPPALDVATRLGVQILRLACDEQGLPLALRAERIVPRHKTTAVTDQALLLHTSGTTARPKIVALSHANLITSSQNIARSLALTPRDRCLNVMPLFHIHGLVGALLASMAAGSSVALPRAFEPACFFDWLDACQASWYTAVPPIHQAVLAMAPRYPAVLARRHLRFVRSSSAALPPAIMAALERAFHAPVVEAYGMTEASHQIAINPLPPGIRKPGSVGIPAGPEVAVVGEDGGIVPREAHGEICIRGKTVMTAYEHNNDANARAFHEGWLRTGDQGFFDADGYLHISGRIKEMINRGGEKVSPMEVEAVLLQHTMIAEAAVFSVPHPTLGEDVAAAIVLHAGTSIDESDLRHWLRGSLTDAKVPQQIIIVDSLPRGPTGKVQRLLLAAALHDRLCAAYLAPRTPTENTVAEIWREVLGVERVGVLDNFLALGGDSLKAVTMISRLRQGLGIEVALASLFAHPVLGEFAEAVRKAARSVLPPITAARRDQALPLSFAQQRLWFLAQMQGINNAYHVPLRVRLSGQLDSGALRRALDCLVARHEALRTSFSNTDDQPVQRIAPEDSGFELQESDLRQHSDAAAELQRLAIEEADTAFDLQVGPLIRGRLVRLDDREHVLLITLHHIISDGWSMGVLTHELGVLYGAYHRGQADPLPRLSIQYPDYALWQRRWLTGEVLQTQSDYWQRTLADAPAVLELPADRRRPAQQDYAGAFVALRLDAELTGQLKALSQRHGATLFITLLAGWAVLLARLSGQDDVVIGVPAANRGRTEIEPLIGFFVNSLALRLDFSASPTVSEALQQVKARAIEAQQHQDLPFEQVVELLRPARSLSHSPLFQVMFAWQNAGAGDPEMPGLTVARVTTPHSVARFDLTLNLAEADGCVIGGLEYATALFDRATIERHAGYLRTLLKAMAADDARAVDRLALLSDAERHRLVVEFNETKASVASAGLIHKLFEEQVQRQPDALALACEERQLTYGELNARANQLAHHLIALGVRPDDRVAICIERSLEMVVGLLGILKAGGAYVPLDPSNPPQRLAYLFSDSAPLLVLTQHGLRSTLPAVTMPVVELDLQDKASIIAHEPQHNPDAGALGLKPANIAYVIYTSGSTGQPKGVMVEHRNLVASTNARRQCYGPMGQFLLLSSIAFDSSVAGIFGALTTLQPLRIAGAQLSRDAAALIDEIVRHQIGCLLCIPTLFRQLREQIVRRGQLTVPLRVIVAGEVCPPEIAEPIATDGLSIEIFNEYGPTECAVWASVYPCRSSPARRPVPIGRPISNTRIYILDRHGEPVPTGVAGEIHIGGAGVARGYLNRPQLTAQRFVADPFIEAGGARMYRSGDLGRYLPDGNIEFLGRNDFQVKIRGFRIELGEIEAQMAQHPAVREAVVLAREDGADKRLVAYYTAAPDAATVGAEALRRHLSATLPEYMLPVAYVRLDALPLTANGKLDRKALPLPDDDAYAARGYEAPVGEIESHLAQLWAELLKLERIGRRDNFFELGGHSLAALRLVARVASTFGVEIGVAALFSSPTIREFAIRVSKSDLPLEPWSVVQIQPLGKKTPIIAINNTMLYYDLARKVGTDRKFLAVQLFDPGNPKPLPSRSLEEITADYVRLIREAQPHGPYILMGLCVAGLIAYEAARQLRRAGEQVPLIVMADTWCPGYVIRAPFLQRILFNLRRRFIYRRHTLALLRSGAIRIENFLATTRLAKWNGLMRLLSTLRLIEDPSRLTEAGWEERWFLPALEHARNNYRASESTGDVVLLQSGVLPVAKFLDPKMGWSNVVKGQLLHYRLPGWHEHMFYDNDAVAAIAELLRPLLNQIGAETRSFEDRLVKRSA